VKMYLLYGLTATVLFALAATVSLMFLAPPNKSAEPSKSGSSKASEGKGSEGEAAPKLRPLVPTKASQEDMAQLLTSLRQRESALKEKEGYLGQRQQQMELVLQDVKSERGSMDDLRKQIKEELTEVTRKLEELNHGKDLAVEQHKQLEKARDDLGNKQREIDQNEEKNIKRLAALYESMSPEGAARYFEQLANSGKLDTAVRILAQMRDRQAAKVLDVFSDASLAAQITEKIRGLRQPMPAPVTGPNNQPPRSTGSQP
jgi:flagellar motility protein MotE (MotC chaperone)